MTEDGQENIWVASDHKEEIDQKDFEESRRCLIDSYHSYAQTHGGYIIALTIGLAPIISSILFTYNSLLQTPSGQVAVSVLIVGISISLVFLIYLMSRVVYWNLYAVAAITLSFKSALESFDEYNKWNNKPHPYNSKAPTSAIIQMAIYQSILNSKEKKVLTRYQSFGVISARMHGRVS